ncbi:VOC family protein [Actinoplanes sp. NPDC051851]|uniref:VOC family protein n=1 Tax=Actinoplanes sp. NPDC051851 TaxID=3154753 RepID=UPI00343B8E2F
MKFASVRLITDQVGRLTDFYEQVTGVEARRYTPDFAEVMTSGAVLAIGSVATAGFARKGSAAILELRVEDVDAEFDRLREVIGEPVQGPTTMPWGNRSLLFRDPDGTLINLFTPVSPEAIARQDR